jgi:hypothetical protein
MTEIDDSIIYTNQLTYNLLKLNNNDSIENLDINSNLQLNGVKLSESNIIVCTKNKVFKINPYDYPIIRNNIMSNLNNPFNTILVDNFYYISDTFNHRIIKVDSNTLEINNSINGLNYPRGLCYNNGFLYVVDSGIDKIIQIDLSTFVLTDYSQIITGIVDLTFDNNIMYITSLLQNIIYQIDTINNNALISFININTPYYIDINSSNNLLISTNNSISIIDLSYIELKELINQKISIIEELISNNPLYNINKDFTNWVDEQKLEALNECSINKKLKLFIKLEEILNITNSIMQYIDFSSSSISSSLEDYKNKIQLTLKSLNLK